MVQKKTVNIFFLKIKCVDKQNCEYILYIISYLSGSIVVNLSCKNSHYYTVQEEQF